MKNVVFLLYVIVNGPNEILGQPACEHLGVKMYETLGCTPQYEPGHICPHHYTNCDYVLPKDNCTFQGKFYAIGETIPSDLTQYDVQCRCHRTSKAIPSFVCAVLDCPEFLGGSPLEKDCYRIYDLQHPCSTGQKCPPFENIECLIDGNTYKEGQRIFPKDSCTDCVCAKGFAGKYEAPFCKKRSCSFELRNANKLAQKCAPVYLQNDGEALCCPNDFVCASKSEDIVTSNTPCTSFEVCHFGQHVLRIGDSVTKTHNGFGKTRELNCTCKIPPYLTCVGKL